MTVFATDSQHVALFDGTTDVAFGPIFTSTEIAADFLGWLATEDRSPLIPASHPPESPLLQYPNGRRPLDARGWTRKGLAEIVEIWRERRVDPETGLLKHEVEAATQIRGRGA